MTILVLVIMVSIPIAGLVSKALVDVVGYGPLAHREVIASALSPDGKWLAQIEYIDGTTGERYELRAESVRSGEGRQLTVVDEVAFTDTDSGTPEAIPPTWIDNQSIKVGHQVIDLFE